MLLFVTFRADNEPVPDLTRRRTAKNMLDTQPDHGLPLVHARFSSGCRPQMFINNTSTIAPIIVVGKPLDFVENFTYLGSVIIEDNGAQKYIKAKLGVPFLDFCLS